LASRLAASLMMVCAVEAKAQSAAVPELDCVIEPQQLVKLATPVVGVIARIDVDRGDVVHKGQVLGKLEDGVEQAALKLARARGTNEFGVKAVKARLDYLRRKNARAGELMAKNIVTQAAAEEADSDANVAEQQLKEAELTLEMARLEVGHAEEALKQRTMISPIDGVVTERLLVPGEYRNEQSPILTLAQIDPLRVEVFVPTSQYGRIRIGSNAHIHPQQPIGGSYSAIVTGVDQVLGCGERHLRGATGPPESRPAAAGRHTLQGSVRCAGPHIDGGDDASAMIFCVPLFSLERFRIGGTETAPAFMRCRIFGWKTGVHFS
jgi:RND family efflux transporter MFP subunit